MNGNTLYNVPDPVNPQDVATKEYTDTTNKAFGQFKFSAIFSKCRKY